MDLSVKKLHKLNMAEKRDRAAMGPVPIYELYGESSGQSAEFWLHCETISSRSSLHQWEIQPHRHASFFQILYIEAGTGDALFEGTLHTIRPPAIITMPPGVGHGYRFSKDIRGFVITTLASHLRTRPGERSSFGAWLAAPRLVLLEKGNDDAAYAAETLNRIGHEFDRRLPGRNHLMEAYLTMALTLVARLAAVRDGPSATDENEHRMELLHGLVQQHFRSHQPASFYAGKLGISQTHLNRVVRRMTGQSIHELIVRKVTDEAKRELVFTFASVQTIALRLGFADPAYFSRFFLRQTGRAPRAWREAERGKLGL
jgi:AraC family transcriptional activator of pobA